jgi:hypothetical protein
VGWAGNAFVRKIGPIATVADPLTLEKYIRQRKLGPEADPSFQASVKRAIHFVCDALVGNEHELNLVTRIEKLWTDFVIFKNIFAKK